jgi:hypothetical protein
MNTEATKNGDGSSDESIGRPSEWREGRYEKAGRPVEQSVLKKKGEASAPPDTTSTPVTQKDYE